MLPQLAYCRPSSLPEACELLAALGDDAVVLAGGTDVVVDLQRGAHSGRTLVSLADVDELLGVARAGDALRIGARTTPAELAASPLVPEVRPELADALGVLGSPQVRNRATVGGNLCSAAPCGDLPPLLIALGARAVLAGPEGRRELPLDAFFLSKREVALRPGELLAEVLVPIRRDGEGAAYEVFGQRAAVFITVAGVAASLRIQGGVCTEARVVLGAVAPIPLVVPEAAAALLDRPLGGPPDAGLEAGLGIAAAAARAAASPIADVRGTVEHRLELVEVLAGRALKTALRRARA